MKLLNTVYLLLIFFLSCQQAEPERPNIILIMTDDQGIGDLGCHGNPWLKTPNLDAFYEESVRLTDFHVSPLCTPTRSALLTGLYPINNGAWATFKGRDAITHRSATFADLFNSEGYKTAMFGKWHLGDNYPVRPTDCGFEYAVHHKSGGVGEISDYWGNDYFDDTYFVNNQAEQFDGYCTDVWFDEAMKYISKVMDSPFFIYLPTNAPHSPLNVPDEYAMPYKSAEGLKYPNADFYGMLANIDENFGRMMEMLELKGLLENTILIFMSDNGGQFGFDAARSLGYNKGFLGNKGDKLEGGHRVPFFIRWPAKNIDGGKDINVLLSHVDLLPTLAGLCNIDLPEDMELDGIDFSELLLDQKAQLEERTVFIHHRQDWRPPKDIQGTCIMRGPWRLLNGNQLYHIEEDPRQQNEISAKYPDILAHLLAENEEFVQEAKQGDAYQNFPPSIPNSKLQSRITLTIQHAIGNDGPLWKQEHIAEGVKNQNNAHAIAIEEAGRYRLSCRRWPLECPGPIHGLPFNDFGTAYNYKTIHPDRARIMIFGESHERLIVDTDTEAVFELDLGIGETMLEADFLEGSEAYGVYYVYLEKINK